MSTPRKAGRRKSGTGKGVKAWAVTSHYGMLLVDGFGHMCVYRVKRTAQNYARNYFPEFRVVPCEIVIGRKK